MNQTLLDTFLPTYQFSERHATSINAPPREVLDVIMDYDFTADRFTAALMALRRLPGRALGKMLPHVAMPEAFTMRTFTPLARR